MTAARTPGYFRPFTLARVPDLRLAMGGAI